MRLEAAAQAARQVRVQMAWERNGKGTFELRDPLGHRLYFGVIQVVRFDETGGTELVGVLEESKKQREEAVVEHDRMLSRGQARKQMKRLTRSERVERDRQIRAEEAAGYSTYALGKRWGLDRRQIARILKRQRH